MLKIASVNSTYPDESEYFIYLFRSEEEEEEDKIQFVAASNSK